MQDPVRDRAHQREHDDDGQRHEPEAQLRGPLHERPAADPLRAPVREGPPDLLLDGLEEAGREREHDDPQAEDGLVVDGRVHGGQLAVGQ